MFAFTGLAGRRVPLREPGGSGFRGGLAVGVVEEAEGFVAEGGGAAAVVVGEKVVAGGCWDGFHRWGSPRGTFGRKVGGNRLDLGDSAFKSEMPGRCRAVDGFGSTSVYFYCSELDGVTMPSFRRFNRQYLCGVSRFWVVAGA